MNKIPSIQELNNFIEMLKEHPSYYSSKYIIVFTRIYDHFIRKTSKHIKKENFKYVNWAKEYLIKIKKEKIREILK